MADKKIMERKTVKDLMVPLENYAVVDENATLLEAILALDKSQEQLETKRQPHRAILVINNRGEVIGKIGQLAFLKALEPKYQALSDRGALAKVGISAEFLSSMMESFRSQGAELSQLCRRAASIKAKDIMSPVKESITASSGLGEAIHQFIHTQALSLLVEENNKVVGLLRLSDLFDEIAETMRSFQKEQS